MRGQPARLGVAFVAWLLLAESLIAARPDPTDPLLKAQLDSGEFAPALERDRAMSDPTQRDAASGQGETHGGGAEPDFDPLIELIQSTIAPNSWEVAGGSGAIDGFSGGVFVDAAGVLQRSVRREPSSRLVLLRRELPIVTQSEKVRRRSPLRRVSLRRLERRLQLIAAVGGAVPEEMRLLAGLERIRYVFVYPETGDLVVAGPADDWMIDAENRVVSRASRRPLVRLDYLVVVLRALAAGPGTRFGCSITPTTDRLARTVAFLNESKQRSLAPRERDRWLQTLRAHLGPQKIEVFGIDAGTRAARVLVEADHHMKLIGMGLEEGVLGLESYLDMVEVPPGQAPPPMEVFRWWFTLNYQAILATRNRDGFELVGQGARVQSENELLTEQGRRIPTGKSEAVSREFARRFTQHFDALCQKYPLYAELQNVLDLALVAALIRQERLAEKVGWRMALLDEPQSYVVELGTAPRTVETVMNHRVIHARHILAGASGGVSVDPWQTIAKLQLDQDEYGRLEAERSRVPEGIDRDVWWWD